MKPSPWAMVIHVCCCLGCLGMTAGAWAATPRQAELSLASLEPGDPFATEPAE